MAVTLLAQFPKTVPNEPLHGLLALTEFWGMFGYPDDSPHTVQGRGNRIAPNEYYSDENFRSILCRHVEWVSSELRDLAAAQT